MNLSPPAPTNFSVRATSSEHVTIETDGEIVTIDADTLVHLITSAVRAWRKANEPKLSA